MALVVIYANLQRLMVFRSSVARIEGRELDPDQRLELTSRMDLLNGVIGRSGQSRSVTDDDVDAVRPVAEFLRHEIGDYVDAHVDVDGDVAVQAAYAAAAAYGASYMDQGTMHMGRVFGRDEWVDRLLQNEPHRLASLNTAAATVAAAAAGTLSPEMRAHIESAYRAEIDGRTRLLAQVDELPMLLEGQDPKNGAITRDGSQ